MLLSTIFIYDHCFPYRLSRLTTCVILSILLTVCQFHFLYFHIFNRVFFVYTYKFYVCFL